MRCLYAVRLALLVLCAAACHGDSGNTAPPERTDVLRVMSFNVNFGTRGDRANVDAVADANADVVLFQESTDAFEDAVTRRLHGEYPHHRFQTDPEWSAGGMGVLSRFPIVSVDELPEVEGGAFFAWRVVVDTRIGKIQILNVHLRPPMSDGGSWVVGYFSTRGNRLAEIREHMKGLSQGLPTLIVGDFNEETDGLAIQELVRRGFTDAIATMHGKTPTWEWQLRGMTLRFQLDHLMHDARLAPTVSTIVQAGRSDHKPIWADFVRVGE